jgi:transcriptional regulator with GAF, ATPase, and Fis domain
MNCAALPSNLIESELFGHEKGAFTGAQSRRLGRFEDCQRRDPVFGRDRRTAAGTAAQAAPGDRDGEFERLGSSETIKVDVRIIAATNRNLEAEVRKGAFREDLWYRLNIFPITMPPLGAPGRYSAAGQFFIDRISKRLGKTIRWSR